MKYAIEIDRLTHHFDENQKILNEISIAVPHGSIYGFLGPNGAGKTTSLRLMLGLLQKQEGEIKIFDKTFEKNRLEILQQTGSLIEYPSIYGQLTAYQNVLVWQKIYQCSKSRIDEVLDIVGLATTGSKKASHFSLGMKQRLGLAIALLNDPDLLILDEPTNGLDPNGIIEIRALLLKLNRENGITIVISSHLLSEIEKLVTHVGLIHKGNILFEGPLAELLETQQKAGYVIVNTSNNLQAFELVARDYKVVRVEEKLQIHVSSEAEIAQIVQNLVQNELLVYEIHRNSPDLESIFMNYIN